MAASSQASTLSRAVAARMPRKPCPGGSGFLLSSSVFPGAERTSAKYSQSCSRILRSQRGGSPFFHKVFYWKKARGCYLSDLGNSDEYAPIPPRPLQPSSVPPAGDSPNNQTWLGNTGAAPIPRLLYARGRRATRRVHSALR